MWEALAGTLGISDTLMWGEFIRALLTVGFLSVLIGTLYLSVKWFTGVRARHFERWHLRFAIFAFLAVIPSLILRERIEALLVRTADPFSQMVADPWPSLALVGLFQSAVLTVSLMLLFQLVGRLYWRWDRKLRDVQSGSDSTRAYWAGVGTVALGVFRTISVAVILLGSLRSYFSYFPRSRIVLDFASTYFGAPVVHVQEAVVGYLPDLAYLAVILIVGRYTLVAIAYFFRSVENGTLIIRGFYSDWAMPTFRLIKGIFLVFILMVSYPYLPGAQSEFFHGFSVFVGALITLGSTGAISNIVSGITITYTRAFRIGDMVHLAGYTGAVIEKSLLVTRLRTSKNEEVSIPNGTVLSGSVLNYSARAASEGVVLSVSAGIGYDVDWRTVHKLMIEAAMATDGILRDPPPKVLLAELGDYAVSYELRAATVGADVMWETHSVLRRNVLDAFNRAGVEIMTPSIFGHRDASELAVPLEQFPNRNERKEVAIQFRPSERPDVSDQQLCNPRDLAGATAPASSVSAPVRADV